MLVTPGTPVTEAAMIDLAALANAKLLPLVNAAIAANQNHWGAGAITFDAFGNVVALNGAVKNAYDRTTSKAAGAQPLKNPQPAYSFDETVANWATELNRIRGDLMEMVLNFNYTGGNNLFQNKNCLVSGPHAVCVNDRGTWNLGADQGKFRMTLPSGWNPFTNVFFVCHTPDAAGLTLAVNFDFAGFTDNFNCAVSTPNGVNQTYNFSFNIASGLVANGVVLNCTVDLSEGVLPPAGATITAVGATVSSQSYAAPILTFALDMNIAVGANPITFAIAATGYSAPVTGTAKAVVTSALTVSVGGSTQSNWPVISPVADGVAVFQGQYGNEMKFVFTGTNTLYPQAYCSISNTAVKGIWFANTLPVPGRNVYLDQDMPPMVDTVTVSPQTNYNIATSTAQVDFSPNLTPAASSLRCGVQPGFKDFNQVQTARPASATPYTVLRDTEFVPFNLGYNPNETLNVNSGEVAPGGGALLYGFVSIPPDADSFKLSLVAGGTGEKGWRAGVLGYGTPLTSTLRIYVSSVDIPDPNDPTSYDFYVDKNTLNLPGDGPAGYFASVLNAGIIYAVQNRGPVSLNIDAVEQTDHGGVAPVRQYFPPVYECFSYSIDDTPGNLLIVSPPYFGNKKIPQLGYTIFKLRAKRLPVRNAAGLSVTPTVGAAITATLGTNILQGDGSLLFVPLLDATNTIQTITIPLNAPDSGDVAVQYPVLAGTELVYHCAQQINLEAWADFQPIFFNQIFGIESGAVIPPSVHLLNIPTAFQYCLRFANKFGPQYANYPYQELPGSTQQAFMAAQYPISAEIYNDLWNLLQVI